MQFPESEATVIEAAADPTRRAVLRTLQEYDGDEIHLEELADRLDGTDGRVATDGSGGRAPASERLVTLHHAALPKLADFGLLDYDPDALTVHRRTLPDTADRLLDVVDRV